MAMSRQLVYVLSLGDVGRIRLRCRQCERIDSFPASSSPSFIGECRHCHATWALPHTPAHEHITRLLFAFRELPKLQAGDLGCELELEISEDAALPQ